MSATPAESERKVSQLENDSTSIYELLTDVASRVRAIEGAPLRQGARLDQIEDNTHHAGARVEQLGAQVAWIDTRLGEALEILRQRPASDN